MRKLIAFDEDTFNKLTELGRDRMATIQDLADEAFLRRIHNKIYIEACDAPVFDQIFHRVAASRGIPVETDSSEFLRKICLRENRTELRACYPADICNILQSISKYENRPIQMSKADLERAAALYFARS